MKSDSKIAYVKTAKNSGCSGDDSEFNEFVGVRYEYDDKNGSIIIHYPKSLGNLEGKEGKERKQLLLDLIRSLKMLKNADLTNKSYDTKVKNINLDKFPLFSYLWVWDDFKSHGRLIFSSHINCKEATGKINWKKTFQGESLYYNGNVYYSDLVYSKKVSKENLLTEIYDYCVYKSLEMIFFLTNLSSNFIHPLYKNIKGRKNEYIACLLEALETVFDDEKKLRYRHMLNIVKSDTFDSLINKNVIGVSSYAGVFEKEIDAMLGNVDVAEYYPEASVIVAGQSPKRLSRLRPDTINNYNDECFIIDSKFYEFVDLPSAENLPAAESVEKQIVYGEYVELSKHKAPDNIFNIFLIPRSFQEEHWNDDIIKYYGYSFSNWKDNTKNYEKVLIYFIDFQYVLRNYKNGYNEELFEKLRSDVIEKCKTIKFN